MRDSSCRTHQRATETGCIIKAVKFFEITFPRTFKLILFFFIRRSSSALGAIKTSVARAVPCLFSDQVGPTKCVTLSFSTEGLDNERGAGGLHLNIIWQLSASLQEGGVKKNGVKQVTSFVISLQSQKNILYSTGPSNNSFQSI